MHIALPWKIADTVRRRASSYDRSGGNSDFWTWEPGETKLILDHAGASGAVQRMWFTLNSKDPAYLRRTMVTMVFDDEETVSCIPFGMLVGTGPWAVNDLTSPVASVMRSRMMNKDNAMPGFGSFNLTWRMPFARSARISIQNHSTESLMVFFYVDYVTDMAADADGGDLLFHATHRRAEFTVPQTRASEQAAGTIDLAPGEAKNLSADGN